MTNNRPIRTQKDKMESLIRMDIDPKSVFTMQKSVIIEDFNTAVEKRASHAYLTSLLVASKQEIMECNRQLGLLPEDGFSKLDMKWR